MKVIVSIAAAGFLASSAAFAQTATSATPPQTTGKAGLQQDIDNDLQKAGFTDVTVVPHSFLVQAKDRSGDPVTMIVGPNTVAAVVAQPAAVTQQAAAAGTDAPQTTSSTAGSDTAGNAGGSGSMFTTVPAGDRLSSEIVGLDVYNAANQDIGTIKDIAYSGGRVEAYILAVGGFLGMGDRYVAVVPADLKVSYDANAKKWHANMDTTLVQLKNAPAFSYAAKT